VIRSVRGPRLTGKALERPSHAPWISRDRRIVVDRDRHDGRARRATQPDAAGPRCSVDPGADREDPLCFAGWQLPGSQDAVRRYDRSPQRDGLLRQVECGTRCVTPSVEWTQTWPCWVTTALRFRLVMGLHANRCGLDSRWDDDRVNRSSEQLFLLLRHCSSDWTRTSNHPKDRIHRQVTFHTTE
jgi:hypothetical protein